MIIFPPSVSRVARGVNGHQAIVFLQLHISAVDREVHHSKHKTAPFLPYVRGRPARGACTCVHTHDMHVHCAYANFVLPCAGVRAHAQVNVRVRN